MQEIINPLPIALLLIYQQNLKVNYEDSSSTTSVSILQYYLVQHSDSRKLLILIVNVIFSAFVAKRHSSFTIECVFRLQYMLGAFLIQNSLKGTNSEIQSTRRMLCCFRRMCMQSLRTHATIRCNKMSRIEVPFGAQHFACRLMNKYISSQSAIRESNALIQNQTRIFLMPLRLLLAQIKILSIMIALRAKMCLKVVCSLFNPKNTTKRDKINCI